MAVAILASKPTESANSIEKQKYQEALKSWAVRVLDANSPVKMTSHEKSAFENNGLEEVFRQMHQSKTKDIEEFRKNLEAIKTE